MSRAMGSLLSYASWKLLIMHVGVGGPFTTFLVLTEVKAELVSPLKKETIVKSIDST